jgi:aminoglycoside phosphotransferase (APT) family kinase protein
VGRHKYERHVATCSTTVSRPACFHPLNECPGRLYSIDYAEIGLSDFGRPGNYLERQIERWSTQYVNDTDGGRDPNMDRLIEWSPRHIPQNDEARIVHGDFRVDNVIFHPSEPRVVAVLDWELSTDSLLAMTMPTWSSSWKGRNPLCHRPPALS